MPITRLLVIEDDPAHAEAISRALEEVQGLQVLVVPSLGAFRKAQEAFQPQLVLMDLNLPDGKATEVLADPLDMRPYPIIVMTSYGSERAAVEVLRSGAFDYLVKSPEAFAGLPRTLERLHREWRVRLERRQAEEALRETHRFNDQVIRCAQEGIIVYGRDLSYQVWNPFMERFTGLAAEAVLGRHPTEVFPFLEEAGVMARLARVLAGGTVGSVDFPFRVAASGAEGWASDTSGPLYNAAGEIVGVIATVRDITEARRLAEETRQHEATFRAYIEAAPIGVFMTDERGRYLQVNPAASRMTGYSREELLEMSVPDLLTEDTRAEGGRQFGTLVAAGYVFCELGLLRKDGQIGRWTVEAVALSPTRFLGFTQDITARRQGELENLKLQHHLQQVQKLESLGSLAGGVAHDMNNVLGAILSLASAHLALQPEDPGVRQAFETIAEAATRGGKMVKSLLTFARQQPAEERMVDLNVVLAQDIALLEHTTLAKVRLVTDFEPDLKPVIGDANALVSAFMNLCVNAVDAMPFDGVLTLRTRNLGLGQVTVEVEDTGTGMPAEVLAKAMDPFFTTKETGKGTGLGLSMVYSTIKAHHGQVLLQSEPGQGTRVRMTFPACQVEGAGTGPVSEVAPEPSAGGLKLLLVDDDELIRRATKVLIEILGHASVAVTSGEEALLELEGGFAPDVVILDVNMPGLGGAGTLPLLRALRPSVPVLLATGRADETALKLVEAHPHVVLMAKPFSLEDLRAQLDRIGGRGPLIP